MGKVLSIRLEDSDIERIKFVQKQFKDVHCLDISTSMVIKSALSFYCLRCYPNYDDAFKGAT